MSQPLKLNPDRLFPADPSTRAVARDLYASVRGLPIVSPHGHTDPAWFATNVPWNNATELGGAAAFLASAASNCVNGHILAVHGDWLAR